MEFKVHSQFMTHIHFMSLTRINIDWRILLHGSWILFVIVVVVQDRKACQKLNDLRILPAQFNNYNVFKHDFKQSFDSTEFPSLTRSINSYKILSAHSFLRAKMSALMRSLWFFSATSASVQTNLKPFITLPPKKRNPFTP